MFIKLNNFFVLDGRLKRCTSGLGGFMVQTNTYASAKNVL